MDTVDLGVCKTNFCRTLTIKTSLAEVYLLLITVVRGIRFLAGFCYKYLLKFLKSSKIEMNVLLLKEGWGPFSAWPFFQHWQETWKPYPRYGKWDHGVLECSSTPWWDKIMYKEKVWTKNPACWAIHDIFWRYYPQEIYYLYSCFFSEEEKSKSFPLHSLHAKSSTDFND